MSIKAKGTALPSMMYYFLKEYEGRDESDENYIMMVKEVGASMYRGKVRPFGCAIQKLTHPSVSWSRNCKQLGLATELVCRIVHNVPRL